MRTVICYPSQRFISGYRNRPGLKIIVLFCLCFASSLFQGCQSVAFYQKRHLVDPIMTFDPNPAHTHLIQKSYYAREGSVGGIGSGAGGGCGCY